MEIFAHVSLGLAGNNKDHAMLTDRKVAQHTLNALNVTGQVNNEHHHHQRRNQPI
jgi:hypothetical protein